MIAVVKKSATPEQLEHFIAWIEARGLRTDVSVGDTETIVGIIGDTSKVDPFILESMSIVSHVQRVTEPFKMASRAFHPSDSTVDVGHGLLVGGGHFQVIAGPSAVEGDSIFELARLAREGGATMLRGGVYKSRTSPYAYQGLGDEGLDLLVEAGHALDMPVVTEALEVEQVWRLVDADVDVIQVGARNAQNYALLKELGHTRVPVLLKRGIGGTIDELLMAAEYVMSEGNPSVLLCERGIRTFETRTVSTFDVNAVAVLKSLTHLPVVVDATNACGYARYVSSAACAATAAGADCLELEIHTNPDEALAGGAQALTPDQFARTMRRIRLIREAVTCDVED